MTDYDDVNNLLRYSVLSLVISRICSALPKDLKPTSEKTPKIPGFNPTEIGAYFLKLRHGISEKLCLVHYLRKAVLTSEKTPKSPGLLR